MKEESPDDIFETKAWLYKAITTICTGEEIAVLKKALLPLKKLVDFEDD